VATYGLSGLFSGSAGFCLLGYTGTVFAGASEQYVLPSVIAVVIGGTSMAGGKGSYQRHDRGCDVPDSADGIPDHDQH